MDFIFEAFQCFQGRTNELYLANFLKPHGDLIKLKLNLTNEKEIAL